MPQIIRRDALRSLAALAAGALLKAKQGLAQQSSAQPRVPEEATQKSDIWLGPGTAKFYSPQLISALREQADAPVLILSGADKKYLNDSANEAQSKRQIQSWLPESIQMSDAALTRTYNGILSGDSSADMTVNKSSELTGIIILPGPSFGPNFVRGLFNINFHDGFLSKPLMDEILAFIAIHEASHIKDLRETPRANPGTRESTPEMYAYEYARAHPALFPNLSKPDKAKAIFAGGRALDAFINFSHVSPHKMISFCSVTDGSCATKTLPEATQVKDNLMYKVGEFMQQNSLLPDYHPYDAFTLAMKRMHAPALFYEYRGLGVDYAFDKQGFLAKYIQNRGFDVLDTVNLKAEEALIEFENKTSCLFKPGAPAADLDDARKFLKDNGIQEAQVRRFVEDSRTECASFYLQKKLSETSTEKVCSDGASQCKIPDNVSNPANPFLNSAIAAVEKLRNNGRFRDDAAQSVFVDNLLAGANFYLDPKALATARAKLDAPQKPVTKPAPTLPAAVH